MGKRVNTAKWMEQQKRWQINVQKDGERRSFYSSTPGRTGQRECNAKADAWLDDNIANTGARISQLFSEYIDTLKISTSKGNWAQVESNGKNWIIPQIGNKRISAINEQQLQQIINQAYANGLSKKTLENIRNAITGFIKYCRKRKATNLFLEGLTIPKSANRETKKILQPNDLKKLFSIDTTVLSDQRVFDKYIYAYRFQVLTGLRPGELIGLKWTDLAGKELHISRSINYYGELTQGKNENAVRCLILPAQALEILEAQKQLTAANEYIFDISNQNHYERRLARFCASNGLGKVTPYELRHTFVSLAKGLSEGEIKSIVGHSKNMDTYGIYSHEVEGERVETAQKISAIFARYINE